MLRRVLLLAVVTRTAAFATVPSPVDDADRLLFDSLDVDESDSLDAGELVMLGDELSYEAGDLPMGYEAFHAKMGGSARASRTGLNWKQVDANTKPVIDVLLGAAQEGSPGAINALASARFDHTGADVVRRVADAVADVNRFNMVGGPYVQLNEATCFEEQETVRMRFDGARAAPSSMQGHDVGPDGGRRLEHDWPQVDVPYDEDKAESIDWRAKGIVTPVKNQGGCSTCVMHATVAVLEAMALKQRVDDMAAAGTALTLDEIKRYAESPAYDLSEAHLASCVTPRANYYYPTFKQKCTEYSTPVDVMPYVYQNGGFILSEASFPYYEAKDKTCVAAACYTDSAFCPGSSAVAPLSAGGSGQHSGACKLDWIRNPNGPDHRVDETNFERTCPTMGPVSLGASMTYVPIGRPFTYFDFPYENNGHVRATDSIVTEQAKMRIQQGPLLFMMFSFGWKTAGAGLSKSNPITKAHCKCRGGAGYESTRTFASGVVAGNCYNHAVMAVAYDKPLDVWTIKDSNGETGGDRGYFYFETGACGAAEWGISGVTSPGSEIGSAPGAIDPAGAMLPPTTGPTGTGAACPVPARVYTCDQYRRANCYGIPVCATEFAAVKACGWLASGCSGSPP
jgi:hypothetical protein